MNCKNCTKTIKLRDDKERLLITFNNNVDINNHRIVSPLMCNTDSGNIYACRANILALIHANNYDLIVLVGYQAAEQLLLGESEKIINSGSIKKHPVFGKLMYSEDIDAYLRAWQER